mmetsp:Transcript_29019/g.52107  ORF Transcript_29019/g.52107 Transcript_29019/m.52107 type:complete len:223 (+) Transcript_29019:23-691(+)
MRANALPGVVLRTCGGPYSTAVPLSMTRTRSLSRIVSMRWAIVNVVTPCSPRSVLWIRRSVPRSTEAVASSRRSTFAPRNRARTMHTSCLCPTLRFCPLGSTAMSRPPLRDSTNSFRLAVSSAAQSAAGECSPNGSRLKRSDPENSTGSCGMMARRCRRVCSPTVWIGRPSIMMAPACRSTNRSRATRRELFPAPVRPTTPTRSPGRTVKVRPLRTGSSPGR